MEQVEESSVEEGRLLQLRQRLLVVPDAEVAADHAAADRALVQFRQTVLAETRVAARQQRAGQRPRGAHATHGVVGHARRVAVAAFPGHVEALQTGEVPVGLLQVLRDDAAGQRALLVLDVDHAH